MAKNGERNGKGQFKLGHTGAGGRPKGSRTKLGEAFVADLYAKWQKHGTDVLDRIIKDDPAQFLKTISHVLPRELEASLKVDVDIDLFAECQSFAQAFRLAKEVIGAEISRKDERQLIEHFETESHDG